MQKQVERPKENKSLSLANEITQKKHNDVPGFQLVDNRPEVIAHRKLQEIANNSEPVKQLRRVQSLANRSKVTQRAPNKLKLDEAFESMDIESNSIRFPESDEADRLNELIRTAETTKERQKVIDAIQSSYGIGGYREGMIYDSEVEDDEGITEGGRAPRIGPAAFTKENGDDARISISGALAHLRLALTLNHEHLHKRQYELFGETDIGFAPEVDGDTAEKIREAAHKEQMVREALAYLGEFNWIQNYRTITYGDEEVPDKIEKELETMEDHALEELDEHLGRLTEEETNLFNTGKYTELMLQIRSELPDGASRTHETEIFWEDFVAATAQLYRLEELRLKPRSSIVKKAMKRIDSSLERQYYRDMRISQWWMMSTPANEIKQEIIDLISNEGLVRPRNLFAQVKNHVYAPKSGIVTSF